MRLASFPRFPLTTTPTPLMRARNLELALGPGCPRVYLKRDDLNGLAFGGNKARKLEYVLADAIGRGSTVVVTEGSAQSNHARLTAAAATVAGLKAVLVLDARHGAEVQGNLFLDRLMGADVRIVPDASVRSEAVAAAVEELRSAGEVPYPVPTGASMPLGALGYVAFVLELTKQLFDIGESPGRLYFASGSGGTQSGILVGARAFNVPFVPIGVSDGDPAATMRERWLPLVNATAELIGLDASFDGDDFVIEDRFYGEGYGEPTPEGLEAIRLLARTEAVFLEPVYTGKAMAALLAHIRDGMFSSEESVVFLHTGGGPSLFGFAGLLVGR
jgi:1-aminocyclopropane-1-carboxylate deaminase/D-cysteine desulfhydrase-like pyridoxal-dependent ACC family enzyme